MPASSLLARIGQSPNETEEERLLRTVGGVSLLAGGTFVLLLCGLYWFFHEFWAGFVGAGIRLWPDPTLRSLDGREEPPN